MSTSSSPSASGSISVRWTVVRFVSLAIPAWQVGKGAEASWVVERVTDLAGEQFVGASYAAEGGGVR